MTVGQKTSAAKTALHIVEDLPEIEDLNRFLVVCALVSDLYCPGYNPMQSLAKDSNLARAANQHRVDAAKLTIWANGSWMAIDRRNFHQPGYENAGWCSQLRPVGGAEPFSQTMRTLPVIFFTVAFLSASDV
jgi:hypothetical protein